jgi:post-segregation antitoxin (ccd killing protein)
MRMPRINIYVPEDLAAKAREAGLNVSRLTQEAIRIELGRQELRSWLKELERLPKHDISHEDVMAALDAARDEFGELSG